MDKIARIRQEIERRLNILTNVYAEQVERKDEEMMNYYHGKVIALEELRPFLDTLSEQPDKNLEEAAEEKYPVYWKNYPKDGIVRSESSYDTNKQCRDAFIAGAEWQASQMPMPEDTVLFNKGVAEGRRLEREDMLKDAVEGEAEELYNDGESQCVVSVGTYFKPGEKVYVLKEEEE